MSGPDDPNDEHPDDQREERLDETQEQRAMRALGAIWSRGDLTAESMRLANEFTDRHTGRVSSWIRSAAARLRGTGRDGA